MGDSTYMSRAHAAICCVAGFFCLSLTATGQNQPELPLPSYELPTASALLPLRNATVPTGSPTRWLTPNLVATPPPLTADQRRILELEDADFRPWRLIDEAVESEGSVSSLAPVVRKLQAIMILPGLPDSLSSDTDGGVGLEAYAASVPVPQNLDGVRDYGAELSQATLDQLAKLVGEPLDDRLVPRIREAVILGFATEKRRLEGILVPEMGGSGAVLKVVVIEALPEISPPKVASGDTSPNAGTEHPTGTP